jgi:cyclopropane fatty-acyl-phospholipid synthase-like methyltransferase
MAQLISDLAFLDRFKAWWYGYEWQPHSHLVITDSPQSTKAVEEENYPEPGEKREWTPERIHTVQMVFGAGCHSPDIAPRTADLIAPLALTPEMTTLEVGAGLGMGARTVVRETGAWIDAVEPNECLADAARRLGAKFAEGDKVTISSVDLNDPTISRRRRDAILSCESLHRFEDPAAVLKQIRSLMKPTGQLILTDYVLPEGVQRKDLQEWLDLHAEPVRLWRLEKLRQTLSGLGFEVHSARDETEEYAAATLKAIKNFARRLYEHPVELRWRQWVMVEIEYWAQIVTMLENGKLKYYRISASIHM